MKIKVWTVLCKIGSEIQLATGSRDAALQHFVYATQKEVEDDLKSHGSIDHISYSYEEAKKVGNRFWIECVEVEV